MTGMLLGQHLRFARYRKGLAKPGGQTLRHTMLRLALHPQSNNKRRPNRFRCQNPTTALRQLLVKRGATNHGVHTTGQATEAQGVQVLWRGS